MAKKKKPDMNTIDWIAFVLIIVGVLNWALVGLGLFANANWNLVQWIFGTGALASIIYLLVGISGLYALFRIGLLTKK